MMNYAANFISPRLASRLATLYLVLATALPLFSQPADPPVAPEPPAAAEQRRGETMTFEEAFDIEDDPFYQPQRVIVGSKALVRTNESIGELIVIGGTAEVHGKVRHLVVVGGDLILTGQVEREAVVVVGNASIQGKINRELMLIMGRGEFGPQSSIGRDSVLVGGPFDRDPSAQLDPGVTEVNAAPVVSFFNTIKEWVIHGLFLGRLIVPNLTWTWVVAGISLLVYLLFTAVFPRSARSVVAALETRPLSSLFVGMLTAILFLPLVVLLATLVIPIPAIPFVKLGFLLLMVFGKAGVMCFLGRSLLRVFGGDVMKFPAIPLLVGGIVLAVLYVVPILGILTYTLATCIGIGGAVLALVNSFSSASESGVPSAPVPVNVASGQVVDPAMPPLVPGAQTANQTMPATQTTPQGQPDVFLLQRVGFWKRFLAAILDLVLLSPTLYFGPLFILAALIYFVAMWTWKGTTIGMIVLGLKLVRLDGKPLNFAVALVRSLSSFFSGLVLFLGFLWAGWDKDKQSWHDKIAGTVIVRMPKGVALI